MPKPLIILESHYHVAAKLFLAQNSAALKGLGYKKVLFELNCDVSREQFKQQLKTLISSDNSPQSKFAKPLLELLIKLEETGIDYQFIDPETQAEAFAWHQAIANSKNKNEEWQLIAKREISVAKRDQHMARVIVEESQLLGGNVIFLGGFKHITLLQLLQSEPSISCSYMVMTNSQEEANSLAKGTTFEQLASRSFRDQYYKTPVHYFDFAKKMPFEFIVAACELLPKSACESSRLQYFNQASKLPFRHEIDDHKVVTGTLEVAAKETADNAASVLTKTFPGLYFFVNRKNDKYIITVPGINMSEFNDSLSQGFIKGEVMEKPVSFKP